MEAHQAQVSPWSAEATGRWQDPSRHSQRTVSGGRPDAKYWATRSQCACQDSPAVRRAIGKWESGAPGMLTCRRVRHRRSEAGSTCRKVAIAFISKTLDAEKQNRMREQAVRNDHARRDIPRVNLGSHAGFQQRNKTGHAQVCVLDGPASPLSQSLINGFGSGGLVKPDEKKHSQPSAASRNRGDRAGCHLNR